jgi:hypothetical protein
VVDLPDSGSSGGVDGVGGACVAESVVGEQLPIDLYMMIDKSGSMRCKPNEETSESCQSNTPIAESRWTAMQTALKGFVSAGTSSGIGVGVGFFPILDTPLDLGCMETCDKTKPDCSCYSKCGCQSCGCLVANILCSCRDLADVEMKCERADYEPPVVEIGVLPDAASAVSSKIDVQWAGGSTPTVPALAGALTHTTAWSTAHPDRRAAVVFATDGEPAGCGRDNTIAEATKLAKAAFEGTPSIPTYVIGIGPSLDNLNQIAEGGGTKQAYLLGSSGDAVAEFTTALNSIRGRAVSCDYKIPDQTNIDYQKVNVQVTVGSGGTPKLVEQALSKEQCADGDGWFYDDPTAPKTISLCKRTCDSVIGSPGSKLEVLMGCKTVVIGPK